MVYGGAPMMSDDAPADELTGFTYPTRDELAALQDELATLRADNDARGALIEQLRAERDQARENVAAADRRKAALAEALDNMRDERNQAHAAYSRALGELDELRRDLELANDRAELRRALELANDRADRQAAHFLRAEADLARQKRFTALMLQALREMTQGEP
jgi:chromosome segregation ATPase